MVAGTLISTSQYHYDDSARFIRGFHLYLIMADIIESRTSRVVIARMKPEEDVLITAKKIADDYNIRSGSLKMIGAVSSITLGYFHVEEKVYKQFTVDEDLEVISCIGNIARTEDGEVVVHAHMVVADVNGKCYGGHLLEGCIVSVTIELIIQEIVDTLTRKKDPEFGLQLLALKD